MNIILPIIGMFIGWITNVIAIEMLFRPRTAIMIGRFKLPFTPGLVPLNKYKIIKETAEHTAGLITDSFINQEDLKDTEQFKLFNTILDSFWITQIFVPEIKRKKMFMKIVHTISTDDSIKESIKKILIHQLEKYDVDKIEKTVRGISTDSLRGIKFIGAVTGIIVGIITMIIGSV
ncbi:hypothetical protein CL621_01020 [archaeon]|nr:hypothetical protein [archaeon]|tara:strand:- start:1168 stop:1695 length:528 start_codon:yes stop_codon:yes gene_type:complete